MTIQVIATAARTLFARVVFFNIVDGEQVINLLHRGVEDEVTSDERD